MNILEQARQHATATTPTKSNGFRIKAASLLYEAIKPLSGQIATYKGSEVRVNVSRQLEEVILTFFAREQKHTNPGHYGNGRAIEPEVIMRDTSRAVATAAASGIGEDGYTFSDFSNLQKSFGNLQDLVTHVAAYIGPMLKDEV